MAGKELKATEKTVLKHSREGVLEQNLSDGSAKKVSNKAEEAVLKPEGIADERFDKLKAAVVIRYCIICRSFFCLYCPVF